MNHRQDITMDDRQDITLSLLAVIYTIGDGFRGFSDLFPDFLDLADVVEGYCYDFLERVKIPREEFEAYLESIKNESDEPYVKELLNRLDDDLERLENRGAHDQAIDVLAKYGYVTKIAGEAR
jgi:hypothetical protein